MAFSEFKTMADVQKKYRIKYEKHKFLISQEIMPNSAFIEGLAFRESNIDVFASEAARSEMIISPLLVEVYKKHCHKYAFWIQKSIFYDNTLQGTPDYIFSQRSELGKTVLESPIVIVVEAKKSDFVQGWAQCLAELVAAQRLNGTNNRHVYGIVTDGSLWQFGRLFNDVFTQDAENFTIDRLASLFGVLESLLQMVTEEDLQLTAKAYNA